VWGCGDWACCTADVLSSCMAWLHVRLNFGRGVMTIFYTQHNLITRLMTLYWSCLIPLGAMRGVSVGS